MTSQINLHIDPAVCRGCSVCLAAGCCKIRAIVRIDPDEPPFLDMSRCYDCRVCIPACPFGAISSASTVNSRQEGRSLSYWPENSKQVGSFY